MDIMTTLQGRRSIRKFKDQPIETEKLNKVLEAARISPSAINKQEWKFIVVEDTDIKNKVAEAVGQPFVGTAPIIMVNCGTNPEGIMRGGQYRYTIDLSIATSYMMLQAYELGLGSCWIGAYDEQAVKDILNIPEGVRIVSIFPIGYPDEDPNPRPRPRKTIEEIVSYNKYQ